MNYFGFPSSGSPAGFPDQKHAFIQIMGGSHLSSNSTCFAEFLCIRILMILLSLVLASSGSPCWALLWQGYVWEDDSACGELLEVLWAKKQAPTNVQNVPAENIHALLGSVGRFEFRSFGVLEGEASGLGSDRKLFFLRKASNRILHVG